MGALYPQNLGSHLSIDKTSLSQGELYTILTNKAAKGGKGGKGAIVAIIAGTKAEKVIEILRQIPQKRRKKVTEITLDMAGNMALSAQKCFAQATQVTAVQDMRIKYRWAALDAENQALEQAKLTATQYEPTVLANGDTLKQLLARSHYVLYKKTSDWTPSQRERARLLFNWYPDLENSL